MLDNKTARYIALGSSLGASTVGPVALGIFAGHYLDQRFGSAPWLSLTGVLLGLLLAALSITQILKVLERTDKQ